MDYDFRVLVRLAVFLQPENVKYGITECISELKAIVLYIVNVSLEQGKFPNKIKNALVILREMQMVTKIIGLLVIFHSCQKFYVDRIPE